MSLDRFADKYGFNGAVVSAVPLVQGIAKLVGLDVFYVDGATGEIDTNLEGKVEMAEKLLDDYDFVVIHVEAPDECTHNGDLKGKIQSIEWLDSRVMTPLVEYMNDKGFDYRIMFLSDHKTLTESRGHDADPVPFMLYDSTEAVGGCDCFNEKNGENGISVEKGIMLLDMLFRR